ncbi:PucR family transcriptional regulator [Geodermatophilaceae bacterium NBWT11]|nr:PucR family transcriptional regulator [Geodermatophilaceae bacterium NBWT11]
MTAADDRPGLAAVLDQLDDALERGLDLGAVLTLVAARSGCRVGAVLGDGTEVAAPPGIAAPLDRRVRCLADGIEVWLAPGDPVPVWWPGAGADGGTGPDAADVLLRRLGIAVRCCRPVGGTVVDPGAAVDPGVPLEERTAVLRRLGFGGTAPMTVAAVRGPVAAVEEFLGRARSAGSCVHRPTDDGAHLVLARGVVDWVGRPVPVGVACGTGPAVAPAGLPAAWRQARAALRFALPSTQSVHPPSIASSVVVEGDRLGPYAVLAEQLSPERIAQIPDVRCLEHLVEECGPEMLRTLLAVASTDSLRQAARDLHVHHNSVAHRVRRAERALGFGCTEPFGRARLLLTLSLHRLLASHRVG